MNYLSVCSGIEAATVAWHSLGFKPVGFSEIEKFPSAVLAHHYPHVKNYGDFTQIERISEPVNIIVGGTPCQSLSIAGKRAGLDDARGNLTMEFVHLCNRIKPRWVVWENVPGVLSIDKGQTFAEFLRSLAECGYKCAYRILDAQYFGVPQRRRRVFVVGYLGDWKYPASVLFESPCLPRNYAKSRKTGEDIAGTLGGSPGGGWGQDLDRSGAFVAYGFTQSDYARDATKNLSPTLRSGGNGGGLGHSVMVAPSVISKWAKGSGSPSGDECHNLVVATLDASYGRLQGCSGQDASHGHSHLIADTLTSNWHRSGGATAGNNPRVLNPVINSQGVRRLTPIECERLQGFPDNYTRIPWRNKPEEDCPDSPRYHAIGNSMAVPVMKWIGNRIKTVQEILNNE